MRKLLSAIATGALFLPVLAFAAYNDAQISSGVTLTVNGINLTVAGNTSSLESLQVTGTTLVAVLNPDSVLAITSSDRKALNHDAATAYVGGGHCNTSESYLLLSYPASLGTSDVTVTITPSSSECGTSGSSSGGGGGTVVGIIGSSGGGGGGGSSAPAPATVVTTPAATQATSIAALQAQLNTLLAQLAALQGGTASVSVGSFVRALVPGSSHADVKRLQQVLNSDPDTRIASSGVGSPGSETNYFGSLTRKAVEKFQVKHGIAKPGDAGYGNVGPKTRAKLNSL